VITDDGSRVGKKDVFNAPDIQVVDEATEDGEPDSFDCVVCSNYWSDIR
jgi:hypothetical protein